MPTFFKKYESMIAAIPSLTISASNTGKTMVVNSAVLPIRRFASSPMAFTVFEPAATATQEGSASTTPLPILNIFVTDDPRSIASLIIGVSP